LGAEGSLTPQQAFAKGDLKFTLEGKRLHGSWVLVRMKQDRTGGKRNNWLLIKHRDDYARDGHSAVLEEDRSIASGRSMADIAAGKGRGPKPFMLAGKAAADPRAVWHSRVGLAADNRASNAPVKASSSPLTGASPSTHCRCASIPRKAASASSLPRRPPASFCSTCWRRHRGWC
jgi:bifunctional non-homologous end joining protein LigD